ncbi:IS481 family transposase, partial [Glycomyces paridis]
MSHANAPLTPTGRLRLARCVVEDGWPLRRAAERFQVSPTTAWRWADRYRRYGQAGMSDRSSRPATSPNRLPSRTERRIIKVRLARRWGPARIAYLLGLNPSTVHRVLTRYRLPRLTHLDRASGEPVRRYERAKPGELVHIDIKKLGNIPDGGGHRVAGRAQGRRNGRASQPLAPTRKSGAKIGYACLHTAIDDHSRTAYTEILADETKESACSFAKRAIAHFASIGVAIERIMTDNGACYNSLAWRDLLRDQNIAHKRTRPYRPQTNGKVERFHRTLVDEWAYARPYRTETERREALPVFLHWYNHHRAHTGLTPLVLTPFYAA